MLSRVFIVLFLLGLQHSSSAGSSGAASDPGPLVDNTQWVRSEKGEEFFGARPEGSECELSPIDCEESCLCQKANASNFEPTRPALRVTYRNASTRSRCSRSTPGCRTSGNAALQLDHARTAVTPSHPSRRSSRGPGTPLAVDRSGSWRGAHRLRHR